MGAYEHQGMIRLYTEDFEDGVADDWDAVSGTWDITAIAASNKVYQAHSTDALARTVVGGHIWDDYEVKATVQVDGWGSTTYRTVGLLARYNDSDNYYLFAYEAPGELRIRKKQAGTITTLASIPFTLNENTKYKFKAVVDGDDLSFYVNGTQQLTAQDSGIATGKAGLISVYGEVSYDDFSVISTDPSLLLMDDYEMGGAAAWDVNSGSWSVVQDGSKVYQGLSTHYANDTTTGNLNWQDYTLQFRMKVDSWGTSSSPHAGMMARYTDSNNYYMFGYKNGELIIQRRHDGTNSAIAKKTFTLSPSAWYTFQAVLQGTTLKLYVNGAEELSVNDANLVSGKIGIHTRYADASFDEVIIRE